MVLDASNDLFPALDECVDPPLTQHSRHNPMKAALQMALLPCCLAVSRAPWDRCMEFLAPSTQSCGVPGPDAALVCCGTGIRRCAPRPFHESCTRPLHEMGTVHVHLLGLYSCDRHQAHVHMTGCELIGRRSAAVSVAYFMYLDEENQHSCDHALEQMSVQVRCPPVRWEPHGPMPCKPHALRDLCAGGAQQPP